MRLPCPAYEADPLPEPEALDAAFAAPPHSLELPPVQEISLELGSTDLSVTPGTFVQVPVRVINSTEHTLNMSVTLTGIPAEWWSITPTEAYRNPNEAGDFIITIHPPKHHTSLVGTYIGEFTARSAQPVFETVRKTSIVMLPYHAFTPAIRPKKVRGLLRARYTLSIENHSNTPLDLALTGSDDEEVLAFKFAEDEFRLGPGERRAMPVRVRSRRGGLFGRPRDYRFDTTITAAQDTAAPQTLPGSLVLNRLSAWLLILPLLLLLVVLPYLFRGSLLALLTPVDNRPTAQLRYDLIPSGETATGAVVPSNIASLTFQRDGVIELLDIKAGETITRGQVLGELRPLEQLRLVRAAEDAYARAQRELEAARTQQERTVALAALDVEQAQEDTRQVLPGGPEDPARQLQQDLTAAQREQNATANAASEAKTNAQADMMTAAEALQTAQQRYSSAVWKNTWVERYGTDPGESPTTESTSTVDGNTTTETTRVTTSPVPLNEVQKQAFKDAVVATERAMQEADRALNAAQRAFDTARAQEVVAVEQAQETTVEAQRRVDLVVKGENNPTVSAANRATKAAQINMESTTNVSLEPYLKAIDEARQTLEAERAKLPFGQIVAPADGIVVQVAKLEGDTVTPQMPVVTLALSQTNNLPLEVAVTLTNDQIIALGLRTESPVAIQLLTPHPMTVKASLRRFPTINENGQIADATTRFMLERTQFPSIDAMRQQLPLDTAAVIMFTKPTAQQKVYWLPPPYVRSDGTNSYIVVRNDKTFEWADVLRGKYPNDQPIYVEVGQRTPNQVEIVRTFGVTDTVSLFKNQTTIVAPTVNQP